MMHTELQTERNEVEFHIYNDKSVCLDRSFTVKWINQTTYVDYKPLSESAYESIEFYAFGELRAKFEGGELKENHVNDVNLESMVYAAIDGLGFEIDYKLRKEDGIKLIAAERIRESLFEYRKNKVEAERISFLERTSRAIIKPI